MKPQLYVKYYNLTKTVLHVERRRAKSYENNQRRKHM